MNNFVIVFINNKFFGVTRASTDTQSTDRVAGETVSPEACLSRVVPVHIRRFRTAGGNLGIVVTGPKGCLKHGTGLVVIN